MKTMRTAKTTTFGLSFLGPNTLLASARRMSTSPVVAQTRRRRVLFNVPGSDERKVEKATKEMKRLDCVVLDLEDGVAPNRKEEARKLVRDTLSIMDDPQRSNEFVPRQRMERIVRINSLSYRDLFERDLEACVLPAIDHIDAVLLPKVEHPDQVLELSERLKEAEERSTLSSSLTQTKILVAIESARGLCNLPSIVSTHPSPSPLPDLPHPRVDALIVCFSLSFSSL